MARSLLRHTIKDAAGNAIQNALVHVYLEGTTTPVSDMFAAASGGSAITTLTSNNQGEIIGYLTTPKFVDLKVTDNSNAAYYPNATSTLLDWTEFTETVQVTAANDDVDTHAASATAHSGTLVPVSTIDAAGDLYVGTGPDAVGRLGKGSALQVLRVKSDGSTLEYADAATSAIAEGRPKETDGTTHYSMPGVATTATALLAVSAGRIRYEPLLVVTALTLDQLAFEVTTAGAGGTTARLGIYNADTNWQPTSLVLDAGTVAVDTTGIKTVAVNQTLSAGRYLLAFNTDAVPTVRMFRGGTRFTGLLPALGSSPWPARMEVITAYAAFAATGVAWDLTGSSSSPTDRFIVCRVSTP